ncbi:DUF5810 domain-containing protein [Natronomonas salsuginis]|jgi:hypothetical protein|uniref:Uncharacterized protein n=1 Tax=Natronomonas salsuginis TaxID=2217661 RepID=A0A4U5J9L9_9EURY|nr:DUF5810 domain-containing protein [Natronomonas salsuginis]TKR25195.1 hypothetical protein DM868_10460 [Natronomonas salsuginis]
MGYACPVCSDPQADAGHLANHLAFTAMLRADGHEAWLDEHAAGWSDMGERELAAVIADLVEETEFPQLFEDTVGGLDENSEPLEERSGALFDDGPGHDHAGHHHDHGAHDRDHDDRRDSAGPVDTSGPMDAETAEVLEEAREMTRRMREPPADESAEAADGDAAGDADGASGDRDDE